MARRKTKMRTGKVKRVKKTRNSRRTKRNTRRRNKRGGDRGGSLELIRALGKSVSGALGRSLKEKYHKYLKRKTKDQTDKGNIEPLLEEQNTAAEATRQEMLNIARTNKIEQDNHFFKKLSEHLATEESEKVYDWGPGGRIKLVKEVRNLDEIKKEKRGMLKRLFPDKEYPQLYLNDL